ncbi:hypothetical protein C8R43DRAFT_603786 [Mycena crocata]|nr:hypothetical protein C8R43DRAFT_603786 [Mycena crocata]
MRWYYEGYRAGLFPSVRAINWLILCLSSHLSSVASTHFVETAMIVGITALHITVAWVVFTYLFVLSLPFIFGRLLEQISHREAFLDFLYFSAGFAAILCSDAVISVPVGWYMELLPWAKRAVRKALYRQESRQKAKGIFWYLIGKYQAWKVEQIRDFWDLVAATPNTLWAKVKSCFEIWCDLHSGHKLLIAGPALAFYGYFYILPVMRRTFRRLVARWRQR